MSTHVLQNSYQRFIALKILIKSACMGQYRDHELQMYRRVESGSEHHPGRAAARPLLDSFDIDGPEDKHRCLIHPALGEGIVPVLDRCPNQRLPSPVLAFVLVRLFLALDYLHSECQIIHTGRDTLSSIPLYADMPQASRPTISCSAPETIHSSIPSWTTNFRRPGLGKYWMTENLHLPGNRATQ